MTFQYPVSVCVARVGSDFTLQDVRAINAPEYRTRRIVEGFWKGVAKYSRASLVTFNGRGFDLPLMELAAFRFGCFLPNHYRMGRNRYKEGHLDLQEWLTNYGACRLQGGLNLLSKLLGKPGKMDVAGNAVYEMYRAGRLRDINDYCMADTLDTYFVFLRHPRPHGRAYSRPRAGAGSPGAALDRGPRRGNPGVQKYLDNWGDWDPWPA